MLICKPSKIYISSANVDMRKSIDGLSSIVEQQFKLNPITDIMFVFHNKNCDKIKLLYWDGEGFCLLYKRMEHGRFRFPKHITSDKHTVTETEFHWLMHGLRIEDVRHYETVKAALDSTIKA